MLFNSNQFLLFLAAFLFAYYFVRSSLAARNVLVVLASYVFYGWWDYRFVSLLFLTSVVDFGVGLGLSRWPVSALRKALLTASVAVNLGVLFSSSTSTSFGIVSKRSWPRWERTPDGTHLASFCRWAFPFTPFNR